MKYICLSYYDKGKHDRMTEGEQNAMFGTCLEYDDHLRANGHKVATTDGPYAETKEQLGGIIVLEAGDMNHAVQLTAQHPALKCGSIFEIRPAVDMNEIMKAVSCDGNRTRPAEDSLTEKRFGSAASLACSFV